ncbi:MAG: hypothetical protein ACYTG0_22270, partial [Planctomycetota bacterium]
MRVANVCRVAVIAVTLFGLCQPAQAQLPDAGGGTIWHFFGLPQARLKLRDNLANRRGNHPGLERKPPLKALADPANLESEVPAIKAAAEIKAQEDLKEQKIKAIKYLASVGCGCYPGVKDALLAALEDCTEEVRLEAAVAFCEASGNPCKTCNPSSCCDADVIAKLRERAFGQDEKGCYKEQSAQVRSAAARALNACQRIVPPTAKPKPAKKELPVETPGKELPTPFNGGRGVEGPPTPDEDSSAFIRPVSTRRFAERGVDGLLPPLPEGDHNLASIHPASAFEPADGVLQPIAGPAYGTPAVSLASCPPRVRGRFGLRRPRPCPPCPPCPPSAAAPTEAPKPGEEAVVDEPTIEEPLVAPPTALAGTFGGAPAPLSAAPNMIGDTTVGTSAALFATGPVDAFVQHPVFDSHRMNLAENNRAMIQDRAYLSYRHFHNANEVGFLGYVPWGDRDAFHIDRFTLAIEKTIGPAASLEFRLPIQTQMASDLSFNDIQRVTTLPFGDRDTDIGNLGLIYKRALRRTCHWYVSGGVAVNIPTAPNASISTRIDEDLFRLYDPATGQVYLDQSGEPVPPVDMDFACRTTVKNETVNLVPFIAALWAPDPCWFGHGFLQVDVPLNESTVTLDETMVIDGQTESALRGSASFRQQALMRVNFGLGRWLYRNRRAR